MWSWSLVIFDIFLLTWLNQLFKQRWDPSSFCQHLQKPSLLCLPLLLDPGWQGHLTTRDVVLKNQATCQRPVTSSHIIFFFKGWRWKHVFVYFALVRFVIIRSSFVPNVVPPLSFNTFFNVDVSWMFQFGTYIYFRKWSGNNSRVNFVILHDRVLSWKNRHQYDPPTRGGRC